MPAATAGQASADRDAEGQKQSQPPPLRDRLVSLVTEAERWHTPASEAFATIKVCGHNEHWPIRSREFRDWLARGYLDRFYGAPSSQAFEDALRLIEADARFKGAEHEVPLCVAQGVDAIYLDLADKSWRAVEITTKGWCIVSDPPVRFMRTRGMRPLPVPKRDGSIKDLRRFVNVASDDDFKLVVGWLVGALKPCGPYTIIALNGEQGSAKSTLTRVLRALIDPNGVPIRQVPRDERDLMIAARNARVVCLDNLSYVRAWLSDALCRLATGGGFSTRQLYTDTDETLFEVACPVILNGIPDLVERPDLADRAIPLTLPGIPNRERRSEADFWAAFDSARQRILGALLDAVSCALCRLPHVKIDDLPRMADFALWVTAAEPALDWPDGSFLKAYEANQEDAVGVTLEADPVAQAVIRLVEKEGHWCGTATDLLRALRPSTLDPGFNRRIWPASPNGLSGRMRRVAPNLRAVGVVVNWKRNSGERLIEIKRDDDQMTITDAGSSLLK